MWYAWRAVLSSDGWTHLGKCWIQWKNYSSLIDRESKYLQQNHSFQAAETFATWERLKRCSEIPRDTYAHTKSQNSSLVQIK